MIMQAISRLVVKRFVSAVGPVRLRIALEYSRSLKKRFEKVRLLRCCSEERRFSLVLLFRKIIVKAINYLAQNRINSSATLKGNVRHGHRHWCPTVYKPSCLQNSSHKIMSTSIENQTRTSSNVADIKGVHPSAVGANTMPDATKTQPATDNVAEATNTESVEKDHLDPMYPEQKHAGAVGYGPNYNQGAVGQVPVLFFWHN
jgi:hypothetical protein